MVEVLAIPALLVLIQHLLIKQFAPTAQLDISTQM
jgi:hypothetical protein